MSNDVSHTGDETRYDEIRQLVMEFTSDWKAGGSPQIEAFMVRVSTACRGRAVRALVCAELCLRECAGEAVDLQDYLRRFPNYADFLSSQDLALHTTQLAPGLEFAPPRATELKSGEYFGRYQLRRSLGSGGFGEVWQAYDPVLDRYVALKTLRSDKMGGAECNRGLVREGQKLAKLAHHGIVSVLDAGEFDGRAFLVSDLKLGGTLQDRIRAAVPIPHVKAVQWVIEVAEAVQYAHQQGYVHRDLKPSNILFDGEGQLFVCDFGISTSEFEQLDEHPSVVGTIGYMSPEQASGDAWTAGPQSDVYSLGAILYVLLTGRLPYTANTVAQYRELLKTRDPRPPRSLDAEIPQLLEDICLACLATQPSDRPATAQALVESLHAWLDLVADVPPVAVDEQRGTRLAPRDWRGPATLVLSTAIAVLAWALLNPSRSVTVDPERSRTAPADATSVNADARLQAWTSPEVLCWSPLNAIADSHGYNPVRGEYVFHTNDVSLFQVGKSAGTGLHFEAMFHINSPDGMGTVGIFWGLNPSPMRSGLPCCWAVQIGREAEISKLAAIITQYDLVPDSPKMKVQGRRGVKVIRLDGLPLRDIHVELDATASEVRRLAINGLELLEEPVPLEHHDWNSFENGAFGFTGKRGNFAVSHFAAEPVDNQQFSNHNN